ncbi:MAG: GspH/FimT family pseudopilin [Gemmatimonadaceae bacterium]
MRPLSLSIERGFTIIEVVIVLAIGSILMAIIVPRAGIFIDRIEVRGAVTEIESSFSLARHAAIARGSQVTLNIDNARGIISITTATDTIQARPVGPAHKVTLSANRPGITYSPIGLGYGAANFTLLVTRNRVTDSVLISRLGRVRHR